MKYTLEHSKRHTDICEHLVTLHSLIVELNAQTVIELGVRDGESTVALLEGVHATGGQLVSVDIMPCMEAREMIEKYGLSSKWTFLQGDDVEFGRNWDRSRPIDLVFIDTDHEYDHTKKEIEIFEPLVRAGGILVFHDTVTFCWPVYGPIEVFLKDRPTYHFMSYQNCNGLGVLRKP